MNRALATSRRAPLAGARLRQGAAVGHCQRQLLASLTDRCPAVPVPVVNSWPQQSPSRFRNTALSSQAGVPKGEQA